MLELCDITYFIMIILNNFFQTNFNRQIIKQYKTSALQKKNI